MEFWSQLGTPLLLLAVILISLFFMLNYFGLLVVKSGSYFGRAAGTPTRFWGEYRHLSGYVSKNFRISGKYDTLSIRMEPLSGSADVEVLDPSGSVLHSWKAGRNFAREISCRDIKRCKVRIASRDFAGKFLVALQWRQERPMQTKKSGRKPCRSFFSRYQSFSRTLAALPTRSRR